MSYESTVSEIEKYFGFMPGFFKDLPHDTLVQMWPVFKKYNLGESSIPAKYRELVMLGVSAAIKCPYSTLYHREAARMMGASEEELAEISVLVSSTGFWSDVLHSMNYDKNKFAEELEKAGEHLITYQE